jgi:hypothetical protein
VFRFVRSSAASQSPGRVMRRTASAGAAARSRSQPFSIDRCGREHASSRIPARRRGAQVVWIFRNLVTNFLETRRSKFHYSVISRHVTDSLAFRYVGSRSLNDEVSALNFQFAAPRRRCRVSLWRLGAINHASSQLWANSPWAISASNRWKKDLCR